MDTDDLSSSTRALLKLEDRFRSIGRSTGLALTDAYGSPTREYLVAGQRVTRWYDVEVAWDEGEVQFILFEAHGRAPASPMIDDRHVGALVWITSASEMREVAEHSRRAFTTTTRAWTSDRSETGFHFEGGFDVFVGGPPPRFSWSRPPRP